MTSALGEPAATRDRGRRRTRQRLLIWDAVVGTRGAHFSAADLARMVSRYDPAVHRATVYRTLDLLVDDGLLLRTDLGAERVYYELATDHRHHHVVCTSCGRVVHVHDDVIAATIAVIEAATGFSVGKDELTFPGRCHGCSGS